MNEFSELLTNKKENIISHYVNEWKMLSQYINDIDRGYINFLTIFTTIATITVTVLSLMFEIENPSTIFVFYIIPLAFIATFGFMGYQFRITAILRGHLAYIEDRINELLDENVYIWNSALVEVYMAHSNIPNNTLMIPVLIFVGVTAVLCGVVTIKYGFFWINIFYWPVVLGLSALVLVPFFINGRVRKKTYKHDEVIEKYKMYLQKYRNK